MRMQFDADAEAAFFERRDELADQFARWLETHRVAGDPVDAALLMDWRFGYGDGALDVWTTEDVGEFLFEWCPRKLAASPGDCAEIPGTVAAFVEFLAHNNLLAGGSARPSDIRRYCERSKDRFLREMRNPGTASIPPPAPTGMARVASAPPTRRRGRAEGAAAQAAARSIP
jgi:hypothetical protein